MSENSSTNNHNSNASIAAVKQEARDDKKRSNDDVLFVQSKRLKTEYDFFKENMENTLNRAMRYAAKGDRSTMDFLLQQSAELAEKIHLGKETAARGAKIRSMLTATNEETFHRETCQDRLKRAAEYAAKGDEFSMSFLLEQAEQGARQLGGVLLQGCQSRVAIIRQSIRKEQISVFLRQKTESLFVRASKYAAEGDRPMMEFVLEQAYENATQAQAVDDAFRARDQQIRNSLADERSFHLRQIEECLQSAKKYAERGDRSLMTYKLGKVQEYSAKAGNNESTIASRVNQIQKLLVVAPLPAPVVKTEGAIPGTGKTLDDAIDLTSPVGGKQKSNTASDDGEVVYEKELSVEERLELRLKEAEAAGEVVQLE